MSSEAAPRRTAVLAVDGGGSKTDVALVARDGRVLGTARGAGCNFHPADHDRSLAELIRTVRGACSAAGIDPDGGHVAELGVFCLCGADLPVDDRRLTRAIRTRGWTDGLMVRNDTFAVLRAGTERSWGIAVVCGTGMNCAGVAPDGRLARYAALGDISGDWGGGSWLGLAAHRAAIRARDGRGPRTELERAVPAHFGLSSPRAVMEAIYLGRLDPALLTELPPVVFDVAQRGDAVGRALIDQLAGEVVAMAGAAIRKLRLTRLDVEVVLGGGVFRNRDAQFLGAIEAGITAVAPAARITVLQAPPVVGSALMGLDRLAASNGALERVRRTLTHERFGGRDQVGADRA